VYKQARIRCAISSIPARGPHTHTHTHTLTGIRDLPIVPLWGEYTRLRFVIARFIKLLTTQN